MAQVEAASVLSVVVRWGPVGTAVNGTLVARPARMTLENREALAPTSPVGEARPRRPLRPWQAVADGSAALPVPPVANAFGAPVLRD
jgi:hypothetical protein